MWVKLNIPASQHGKVTLADLVISAARSLIGQREEPNNSGFKDKNVEKRMKEVGWNKGQAWCSYAAELAWKEGFGKSHPLYIELDKRFSGSARQTLANFKMSDNFKTGTEPKPGALCVWKLGNSWQGHIGIVSEVLPGGKFKCIEGNTNASGGREGIEWAEKTRQTGLPFTKTGLNIEGFVYLPE